MRAIIASLYAFVDKYMYWLHIPRLGVIDIVEIVIIAVMLYYVLVWFRKTRAWTLFKGLVVLLIFLLFAAMFQMNTILWLFSRLLNFAVIALIIIFQPELRRALESLGRNNPIAFFSNLDFSRTDEERFSQKTINELVRACFEMGRAKTGALIVIEKEILLDEYIRTGIRLDAAISNQLLLNIFEKNTPLHDGAIIIRQNRIIAATCYLPLSDNMQLSKSLGTRHRAAVGISEVSDSLTLIVSEENGSVSIAERGRILRNLTEQELKARLREHSGRDEAAETRGRRRLRRGSR